ncbi:MAG: hypothetical protein ABFS43_07950 [Thermodesulfobacteriota bacterium]
MAGIVFLGLPISHVNAGDMNALMANPQFRRLMENAKIKEITREAVK